MARYWLLAPYKATKPEIWERMWQFDLDNGCISIGWGILGDISKYDEDQLKTFLAQAYPDKDQATKTKYFKTLWDFFHTIKAGDIIIARKGTKCIAAVGIVTRTAYFDDNKNTIASVPEDPHLYFLDVNWLDAPRNKEFSVPVFGIQTLLKTSETRFQKFIGTALYLNGVYESVLHEIIIAQKENPNLICYLQPYKQQRIVYLDESKPTPKKPIQLYISTTTNLEQVSYRATIVGWEDKQTIPPQRLDELNKHIQHYQPKEEEIYQIYEGKRLKNLISVISLELLPYPFPVSDLIKTVDCTSYQTRSMSGGWAPVIEIPNWLGHLQPREQLEVDFVDEVKTAQALSSEARLEKLSQAPRIPEKVQVISTAYRRSPYVVAEVLARAKGICERCGKDAPFRRKSDGTQYLEVHHWVPLAAGGEDTVENAKAVCPNCHRELHFGKPKD